MDKPTFTREALVVERIAEWFATEMREYGPCVGASWPEHDDDTGYRDGGYVRLQPSDVQGACRDNARRLLALLTQLRLPAEAAAPLVAAGWQSQAVKDVLAERRRRVEVEGCTPEHDDEHDDGELALAAACYALPDYQRTNVQTVVLAGRSEHVPLVYRLWPWACARWKPKGLRQDLVKSAALLLADIERLDRAAEAEGR